MSECSQCHSSAHSSFSMFSLLCFTVSQLLPDLVIASVIFQLQFPVFNEIAPSKSHSCLSGTFSRLFCEQVIPLTGFISTTRLKLDRTSTEQFHFYCNFMKGLFCFALEVWCWIEIMAWGPSSLFWKTGKFSTWSPFKRSWLKAVSLRIALSVLEHFLTEKERVSRCGRILLSTWLWLWLRKPKPYS